MRSFQKTKPKLIWVKQTKINPSVGCIVVKNNSVISSGTLR